MSISLDIMTEKNFEKLLKEYDTDKYNINPINLLEKLSQYYTNFSGKLNRLYDIISEGEQIINNFSQEEDFLIYKLSKKYIIELVNKSNNDELVDKWGYIIEAFEISNDTAEEDYLYFIICK
mgnify:CR=1 FL=1